MLAPLAGALVTLSLAPFELWPAGILSCAIYAYLLCTCSAGQALWRGWLYGLGMFGSGVSWVYVSIHVHGYASVPLAVFLTACSAPGWPCCTPCSPGVMCVCTPLPGGMLVGFPALWVLFEWLRGWLLTGFPWLYLGYAHIDTWISGWAPIIGVFGLSFICALTGTCLFLAWRSRQPIACTTYAVIVITLWGGGACSNPPSGSPGPARTPQRCHRPAQRAPGTQMGPRLVPPDPAPIARGHRPLLGRDIVIWPEAAVPNYYQRAQEFLEPIAERASNSETTLITGIPYRDAAATLLQQHRGPGPWRGRLPQAAPGALWRIRATGKLAARPDRLF